MAAIRLRSADVTVAISCSHRDVLMMLSAATDVWPILHYNRKKL